MKLTYLHILTLAVAAAGLAGCHSRSVDSNYDAGACEELSIKIERRDSLSQQDYTRMIGQNEAILKYLVQENKHISQQPDSLRNNAWRNLLADPVYLERFGYMFTLGSALYSAEAEGRLDKENKRLYDGLDRYNRELAEYAER